MAPMTNDLSEAFEKWRTQDISTKDLYGPYWEAFKAGAALSAPTVPDGWVLAPVEPTPEMTAAGARMSGPNGTYIAMLAASPQPPASPSVPVDEMVETISANNVAEAMEDGRGFWRECSGCHELNDGYPTGRYSKALKCHVGLGCHECGGIGAIWDTTDYGAMGDAMASAGGEAILAPTTEAVYAEGPEAGAGFIQSLQGHAEFCDTYAKQGGIGPEDLTMLAGKFRDAAFVLEQLVKLRDGKMALGWELKPAPTPASAELEVADEFEGEGMHSAAGCASNIRALTKEGGK